MKWTLAALLLSMVLIASTVKVVDNLGFPIEGAVVCTPAGCVEANASGLADIGQGPVEIYIGGLLTWRTPRADGNVTALLYRVEKIEITPLQASGEIVVKLVKTLNGTYVDARYTFYNNTLTAPLYIGNINYQVEIYIYRVGNYALNATVKTTIWDLSVDLAALGYVYTCSYNASHPITRVAILAAGLPAESSDGHWHLLRGVQYVGVAHTAAVLPNGSNYVVVFDPYTLCNKTLAANLTRLIITAVDSFGAVRNDWAIDIAGRTYRGRAEIWAAAGHTYEVSVDAGFQKKRLTVTPRGPFESVTITVENAYLVLNYKSPVSKVYIIGNYTYTAAMPRRVELPPGVYKVVVETGGRNQTYTIELRPGEISTLTVGGVGQEETPQGQPSPATYAFVAVVATIVAVGLALALTETLRRRQLRRGQSRSSKQEREASR